MIIILILFLFFLISGIQLLRGKFQWLIPEEKKEKQKNLQKKQQTRSERSKAVGILFLFCSLCILMVGVSSVLQIPWLSRAIAGIMCFMVLVGLVFISVSGKFRK